MFLDRLRFILAQPKTSVQLCVLGIVAGSSAALLIILFRLAIEHLQLLYLQQVDDFTTMPAFERLFLPFAGVVLILLFAYASGFKHYRTGIPYVIHRLKHSYGYIPLRSTLNQFFGGVLALASGFSVGREGPSVHLGAAASGFIGRWLKLPYNSTRILVGCGIAAGISASFNTPFAAVIFVMEVVLREYRIHLFVPVMLAAACGSVLTRVVFGEASELAFLRFVSLPQWYYLYLVLFGIGLGALATLFNRQLMFLIRATRPLSMVTRLLLAALLTSIVGYMLPQAMGSGVSAIQFVIEQPENLMLLSAILAAKFLLTIGALGLGVPGGVIGPVFGMGALAGTLLLVPLTLWMPQSQDYVSSFALLGIAGLLTAVLHAPLAALSAVMELSFSPEVILPAMLVIVPAYVTSTQLFKNRSIFLQQLEFQKLSYRNSSVQAHLQKTGVLAMMNPAFRLLHNANEQQLLAQLNKYPDHAIIHRREKDDEVEYLYIQYDVSLSTNEETPTRSFPMPAIASQATLAEAYNALQAKRDGAVYIYGKDESDVLGVLTWNQLRNEIMLEQY
ncbi:chloride channel protein [Saliniradius amylolyticus]|nr:chloride channel protein [Saliniradius amylolyticus]